MADQLQLRGGTTAQTAAFTGALREVTVDTDKDTLVVHDGALAGGYPLMREDSSNSALALGSAATPSLKFTGDTNTGIYSPGADQVAISTNGTGRLFVDASGLVGVGNSSPNSFFHVKGGNNNVANIDNDGSQYTNLGFSNNGTEKGAIYWDNSNSAFILGPNAASSQLLFRANNAERARIDSSGRLGIGTSSVSELLQVSKTGGANIQVDSGSSNVVAKFGASGAGAFVGSTSNDYFQIYSNNTARIHVTSAGLVGIGTTPETTLDVNGAITLRPVSLPGTGKARIYERDSDSKLYIQTGTGNAIRFLNSSQTDLLNIDSSGRLLVGTSSGDHIVTIKQNAQAGLGATLQLRNDFGTNGSTVRFLGTTNVNCSAGFSVISDDGGGGTGNGNYLSFYNCPAGSTTTTERMRISNGGQSSHFAAATVITSASATGAGTGEYLFVGQHSATAINNGTDSIRITTNGNITNTNNSYGAIVVPFTTWRATGLINWLQPFSFLHLFTPNSNDYLYFFHLGHR
jgi:hypothetical protein